MVPRGCLQLVIVVFPDRTHLLFLLCSNGICLKYLGTYPKYSDTLNLILLPLMDP